MRLAAEPVHGPRRNSAAALRRRCRAALGALFLGLAACAGHPVFASQGSACSGATPLPAPLRSIALDPARDYCSALNEARPGDEFAFAPGMYDRPCAISIQGTAENPVVIRSADSEPSRRARFTYSAAQYKTKPANFLELRGQYVVLKDLSFADNNSDIVIRLLAADHVIIESNIFDGLAGQAITANSAATRSVYIRNNVMRHIGETAIYVGHHEGAYSSTGFLIEGNYIDASDIHDPTATGYAAEVKLNSWGTIRDNSFFNAQGPDLMVYGSRDPKSPPNVVDGNYLENSRKDASLNVGGGPAQIINNVIINRQRPAILAQNYGRRDLQRGIVMAGNTVISFDDAAVSVEAWRGGRANVVAGNALYGRRKFKPEPLIARAFGNVDCRAAHCFAGSAVTSPYRFQPVAGGPLAVSLKADAVYPKYDFGGSRRTVHGAGAFAAGETVESSLTYLQPRPPRLHCRAD